MTLLCIMLLHRALITPNHFTVHFTNMHFTLTCWCWFTSSSSSSSSVVVVVVVVVIVVVVVAAAAAAVFVVVFVVTTTWMHNRSVSILTVAWPSLTKSSYHPGYITHTEFM
jgi:hypothetical protein